MTSEPSRDWLASARTNVLAWWLPHAAIVAGLYAAVPVRPAVWTIAVVWMGAACILNARRCGRTHCRYTGQYYLDYLAMIVAVLGSAFLNAAIYAWVIFGVVIVAGAKLILVGD